MTYIDPKAVEDLAPSRCPLCHSDVQITAMATPLTWMEDPPRQKETHTLSVWYQCLHFQGHSGRYDAPYQPPSEASSESTRSRLDRVSSERMVPGPPDRTVIPDVVPIFDSDRRDK